MDEEALSRLVEQVKILSQTMETMISRSEQLYKLQEEKSTILTETVTRLNAAIDKTETFMTALEASLNESDGQLDDLATVTEGLLETSRRLSQQNQTQG